MMWSRAGSRRESVTMSPGSRLRTCEGLLPPHTLESESESVHKSSGRCSVFKGTVLSIGSLVARSVADDTVRAQPAPDDGRFPVATAARAASHCRDLHRSEDASFMDMWRLGVLQTVDVYEAAVTRGGSNFAAQVFTEEPPLTGQAAIDAAFAALAAHLADRDGWSTPGWAESPERRVEQVYLMDFPRFVQDADRRSPTQFRRRGLFITPEALSRV